MNRPSTLLLAVTDCERDRHAARQGIALAASLGAAVAALSVIPRFEGGMSLLHFQDHVAEIEAPHKAVLDWVRQEAARANVPCTVHLGTGIPFETIIDTADRCRADWIVLGASRRGMLGASLLGPTAGRVIGYSRREILVVPEGATTGLARLLLCLDGSECSQRAADLALDLARSYAGALCAACVVDVPSEYHVYEKMMLELTEKSKATLDGFRLRAEAAGVPVTTLVRHGQAADTLLELAAETAADLIVMGSHGRTGLSRLLMGSVVDAVLQRARAPMLVAP